MATLTETTAKLAACLSEATICSGANCLVPPSNYNAKLSRALSTVLTVMLALIMFTMGCAVEAQKLWGHLKRPWGIAIGFLCQFGFMPLAAFALSFAFNVLPVQALVIIILGCCPGGSASNIITILLDGDIDLSISMTACSTTLALGMMPLCLLVYTSIWTADIQIPYNTIGITLVAILVPITGGMYLKHKRPQLANKILKVGAISGFSALIVIIVVGKILYQSSWNIAPSIWIIGTFYPFIGFGMGLLLARLVGQPWFRCRTIAVETGFQNATLCNTIIQLSFSAADLELMFAFPVIYGVSQLVVSILFVGGYKVYKRYRGGLGTNSDAASLEQAK